MTEEIINGVNVAGCKYYTQDYQRANNIEGRYEHCKDVCELNGDNYFYCKMNNDCYFKQLKRLEQENKKLKEENITAQKEYWKLEQGNDFLAEKVRLYRSALEEIREELCYGRTFYEGYFDSENLSRTDKVIKKINEVLGNEGK